MWSPAGGGVSETVVKIFCFILTGCRTDVQMVVITNSLPSSHLCCSIPSAQFHNQKMRLRLEITHQRVR